MNAGFVDTPIEQLAAGELPWKDYINSLSREDLARQRQCDRARAKKWYQQNKEDRIDYSREYYHRNKEKLSEQHTCDICGGVFNLKTKHKHVKTQNYQQALEANTQNT